jgi:bzd-type benzoyl-CoA reductase N subunit
MESILNTFVTANETPYRSWPERYPDRQAMGYICTYTPEEVIQAAGFTPVRLRTGPELPTQAEAHLQSFTCALCRSALHQALHGDLAFLSGLVFPHTCDTLQVLADIWRENFELFVATVVQPLNLGSPSARSYLVAELQRFRQSLAGFNGQPISDDSLRASIQLHNKTRYLLSQLDKRRTHLTARGFYAAVEASMVMPKEQFNPLAIELVELLSEKTNERQRGPRLMLAGPVLDDVTVLDIIDDLGACVVGDDLCTGSRYFDQPVAEVVGQVGNLSQSQGGDGDPIEALADRYLKRWPCPTKHSLHCQRGEHLLKLVEERKADGLVFTLQKFCEPHAFDYAIVKETLDAAGVPHLLLELEHTPAVGQLRTRLEAFLEMLKA